jgi:hypothetical protein
LITSHVHLLGSGIIFGFHYPSPPRNPTTKVPSRDTTISEI